MKCPLGESLADFGFSFYEDLHSPIFLLHKSGVLKKVNEAGRKLLQVGHISNQCMSELGQSLVKIAADSSTAEYWRVETKHKNFKLVTKLLESSDYVLVEVIR